MEKIMKTTLTILTEAEQIGVSIAQYEGENATATRKVEDLEKALSDAVAAQQSVQDRLDQTKDSFEQFLTTLPETLPAEKVREITKGRVAQLVEAGLLEGLEPSPVETEAQADAPAKGKAASGKVTGKKDDAEAPAEDTPAAGKAADKSDAKVDAKAADEAGDSSEQEGDGTDLLAIDMKEVDGDQQPSSSDDEVVALADKEKPSPKRGQAKVGTPEFVDA